MYPKRGDRFQAVSRVSQASYQARFGWLFDRREGALRELWDEEIRASRSFVAVPSLGSLVPGWLLIVPRRRMLSLRDLDPTERAELMALQLSLAQELQVFGGTVFAFEHGTSQRGSVTGCGVDQAHLHLVPLDFDLIDLVMSVASSEVEWETVCGSPLTRLPSTSEYVSVWQPGSEAAAIGTVKKPVSQWMRRLVARKLGIEEEWNYRTSPKMENIRRTVETLRRTIP